MMMYTKTCVECEKQFITAFQTKKYCSLICTNTIQRNIQRKKAKKLKELEEENKQLKKEIERLKK